MYQSVDESDDVERDDNHQPKAEGDWWWDSGYFAFPIGFENEEHVVGDEGGVDYEWAAHAVHRVIRHVNSSNFSKNGKNRNRQKSISSTDSISCQSIDLFLFEILFHFPSRISSSEKDGEADEYEESIGNPVKFSDLADSETEDFVDEEKENIGIDEKRYWDG